MLALYEAWQEAANPEATTKGLFYPAPGSTQEVVYVGWKGDLPYAKAPGIEHLVSLTLGRRLRVDFILPEKGVTPADLMAQESLDQVLNNLMANALRHTPPGGSIALEADPIDGAVRIVVRDTGEGIPPEDLPHVFDRFWRGDLSRSPAGGAGSGLGLAIARQLVQAQGGRISVESQLGQETVFTIELPAGGI